MIELYFAWLGVNHIVQKIKAFESAKSLAKSKGIINLGAGPHRTLLAHEIAYQPEVRVNVDVVPDGMPHFIQLDLEERFPFHDKEFDVTFASHVLEHITNWKESFGEMRRIADWVVIVLPHPLSIMGYLDPTHKQNFGHDHFAYMRSFPNVLVFY